MATSVLIHELRSYIRAQGIRLQHVAEELGVDPSIITRWCQEKGGVPSNKVRRLATMLEMSPEMLLNGSGYILTDDDSLVFADTQSTAPVAGDVAQRTFRALVNGALSENGTSTPSAVTNGVEHSSTHSAMRRHATYASLGVDGGPMGPWPKQETRCSCGQVVR